MSTGNKKERKREEREGRRGRERLEILSHDCWVVVRIGLLVLLHIQ